MLAQFGKLKKKDLLAMIRELQDRVDELERKSTTVTVQPTDYHPVRIPSQWQLQCVGGQEHVYPTVWNSVPPPLCLRCGRQGPSYMVTTSDTSENINSIVYGKVCSHCSGGTCSCGSGV